MNKEELQKLLGVRQECLKANMKALNTQIELMELVRTNSISDEEFIDKFRALEQNRQLLITLEDTYKTIMSLYLIEA